MSRLSKNVLYNLLGQGLVLVLGFVAVKYVFKQLGEDALGIIYFTLTLNAILCAVLEMGICSTTTREVAAHFSDDPGYIRDLIRTASLFYWGAYVLLAVGIGFGAPFLVEKWITLKMMDTGTATRVLQILGVAALVALPRSLYTSLFRGLQRMEFNNFIDVLTIGYQQVGIIVILASGGGLFHVTYWLAISFVLHVMTYLLVASRFFHWEALVPGYSYAVIRRNLRYSSNMMSISVLAMVHMQADKLMVSKFLLLSVFGYYSVAYGAISRSALLTSAVAHAALPSFSSLFRTGRNNIISQYQKLQDLVCFGTVPLFAAIPFGALPVFGLVFNPEVAQMLLLPVSFLSLGFYMNGTLNVPYVFSLAVGKPEISSRSNLLALFIIVPLTGVLIYLWGLTGAGVSWVFYHLFAYAYAVPRICSECLGMPVREWYSHVLRIFAFTGLTYGVSWLILASAGAYSIVFLALAYALASIVFLIGAYWLMGDEVRQSFIGLLGALGIEFRGLMRGLNKL